MTDRTIAPPVHDFPALSMPQQSVENLANGSVLHYYADKSCPIVRLCLQFAGGAAEMGLVAARLVASLLSEGCEGYTADELADIFDYNGARFAVRASDHHISVELNVLGSRLRDILPTIRAMIVAPLFPADHLEVMRMRLLAEWRNSRLQAPVLANETLMACLFGQAHYMAHVIGEHEIAACDAGTLLAACRKSFAPSCLHVYVSGGFDNAILDDIKALVLSLPENRDACGIVVAAGTESLPALHKVPFDRSLQSAVMMGRRTIGRSSKDYIDLRLTVMALGGYFGSRLMTNIREEKGLTYGIYASLAGGYDGAYLSISAQCDKSFTDTVVSEIRHELKTLTSNPPVGEEMESLKSYAMSALAEMLDTPYSIMGYYATQTLVGTPPAYFEAQQRAIEALTSERIAELAMEWLNPDEMHTVIVG